jgi:hypothetical protein
VPNNSLPPCDLFTIVSARPLKGDPRCAVCNHWEVSHSASGFRALTVDEIDRRRLGLIEASPPRPET